MRHYGQLACGNSRYLCCVLRRTPGRGWRAHRATDRPAGSSPSMKWINPPVAYMLHAGVPLLLAAGVHLPGCTRGCPAWRWRPTRPAGARSAAAAATNRDDCKADARAPDRPFRSPRWKTGKRACSCSSSSATRSVMHWWTTPGRPAGRRAGLLQAAWADARHAQGDAMYGLPRDMDPLEGWICYRLKLARCRASYRRWTMRTQSRKRHPCPTVPLS